MFNKRLSHERIVVEHVIGADPYIGLPINAVQNEDGTVDRIKHFCNKLWK